MVLLEQLVPLEYPENLAEQQVLLEPPEPLEHLVVHPVLRVLPAQQALPEDKDRREPPELVRVVPLVPLVSRGAPERLERQGGSIG